MEIALINGSPKSNNSTSEFILKELKKLLKSDSTIISEHQIRNSKLYEKEIEQLTKCDVLVFVFPLYVDGIPSHLLHCLIQLEDIFKNIKEKEFMVYSLVNCGFHEGHQNKLAIEMMENWCRKTGLKWGQGIGIGSGGMLLSIKNIPSGHGPRKNLDKGLKQFISNILKSSAAENSYITPNFPRFAYKLAGEMGWRKAIKANGLKRKDLFFKK